MIISFSLFTIACGNGEDSASSTLIYQTAQNHVKRNLHNPDSAKFPLDKINEHIFKTEEENIFFINSYFRAQNRMGLTVERDFTVTVEYMGNREYRSYDLEIID